METIAERDEESSFSQFDIPSRDAGFHGAPNREMVLLQPSTSCLVALNERPVRPAGVCVAFLFLYLTRVRVRCFGVLVGSRLC